MGCEEQSLCLKEQASLDKVGGSKTNSLKTKSREIESGTQEITL